MKFHNTTLKTFPTCYDPKIILREATLFIGKVILKKNSFEPHGVTSEKKDVIRRTYLHLMQLQELECVAQPCGSIAADKVGGGEADRMSPASSSVQTATWRQSSSR
jgi:hypothetical protein